MDQQLPPKVASSQSFRIFSDYECELIDPACRNYILQLEQIGILDFATREMVLHQIVDLCEEGIDVSLVKWVTLLVLFNQPNAQAALAHMELLVLEQPIGGLH